MAGITGLLLFGVNLEAVAQVSPCTSSSGQVASATITSGSPPAYYNAIDLSAGGGQNFNVNTNGQGSPTGTAHVTFESPGRICLGPGFQASAGNAGSFHAFIGIQQTQPITFTTNPSGLTIIVDGASYTAPATLAWAPGGDHVAGVPASPQSAGAGAQYVLGSWSGGISSVLAFPAPASPTTFTANYVTQYYLTTSATAGGSILPGSGWYDAGSFVPVTANANSGYWFSGFGGSLSGTANPQTKVMNGPGTVTASFASSLTITTSSLAGASPGYGYYQTLTAAGGSPSYSWSLSPGSTLPSWLALTPGGTLSGTPPLSAEGATVVFAVQATDSNGLVSAPQDLSLPVYYSTLSINGGPSSAVTLPSVVVPFTYSLYDVDYGANDIQYAQFYLADSAGNAHCYGDWGRSSALDLYDGDTGTTNGFGIVQRDAFCMVSLVSVTNSSTDPTEVTVVLNFTFNAAVSGSFSVQNQVNYASYVGAWESVGTLQINPAGGVLLTDLTQGTGAQAGQTLAAWVGDSFTLAVAGTASQAVTVAQNGGADVALGSTDSNGNWSTSGTWQTTDVGSYSQVWKVGGTPIAPNPVLFQISQFPSSYTGPGTPPPVLPPTGPPDISAPHFVSGSAQQCTDVTGNWQDSLGGSWVLVQKGNVITGSVTDEGAPPTESWTVSGTVTNSVATVTGTNPTGVPPTYIAASSIKLVFTAGCTSANGLETITFPVGQVEGPTQTTEAAHLTRTTPAPSISLSFDISSSQNQINVTLIGPGKSADLTVSLTGSSSPVVLRKTNVGAGPNQAYSFNRLGLATGPYTQVVAQWDTLKVTVASDVVVLGSTRFSQYNTPNEGATTPYACPTGTSAPIYVLTSIAACTWATMNVNPTFRVQTNINGTGITAGSQIIKNYRVTSQSCNSSRPLGAVIDTGVRPWPGNTFQAVPSVTGACGTTLYSGSSVAAYPGPHDAGSQFSCSSKILVLDSFGSTNNIKAVQDRCAPSGCKFDAPHIDTYTSAQACTPKAIGDLPLSPAFAISVR